MSERLDAPLLAHTAKPTILIVEDDVAIGYLIALTLAQETPYQPNVVENGQEALRAVQEMTPVLFILDYQLPSMTGLQLYDQLHRQKRLETVPAILMSANLPLLELEKRHLLGLTKPFELDDLLNAIAHLLG